MMHTYQKGNLTEVMEILTAAEEVKPIPEDRLWSRRNTRNMLTTLINLDSLDTMEYWMTEIAKGVIVSDVIDVLIYVVLTKYNDVEEYDEYDTRADHMRKATNIINRMSYTQIDEMFRNLFTTWGEMMTEEDECYGENDRHVYDDIMNLTEMAYKMPAVMELKKLYF